MSNNTAGGLNLGADEGRAILRGPQTVDKVKSAVIFLQKGEEPKGKEGGNVEIKRVEPAKEKEVC